MSLIGGAILPHSPLLLPGLTISAKQQVEQTSKAIQKLAQNLSLLKPDVLFLIATHTDTTTFGHDYAFLQSPNLIYEFSHFGDMATRGTLKGAVGFTHRLKERIESNFSIPLVAKANIPYTFAVPVVLLSAPLIKLPLICLQIPNNATYNELGSLGGWLGEELKKSKRRVVVLACGDLGQDLKSPDHAKVYRKVFINSCTNSNLATLANLDSELRASAQECLWSPTILLWSLWADQHYTIEDSSYESVAGTGLIVARLA